MPVSDSPEWAWDTAEQRCFDYLNKVLGSIPQIESFRGALPRLASRPDALIQWAFAINGGANVLIPPPEQRGNIRTWHNESAIVGRFTDRRTALQIIGLVRKATPAGTRPGQAPEIEGVQSLYILAHPQVSQITVELESDLDAGGLVACWSIFIPMAVCYDNQDKIT